MLVNIKFTLLSLIFLTSAQLVVILSPDSPGSEVLVNSKNLKFTGKIFVGSKKQEMSIEVHSNLGVFFN
jgi:hypothetical protein